MSAPVPAVAGRIDINALVAANAARKAAVRRSYAAGVREFRLVGGAFEQYVAITPDPASGGASWRATFYDRHGLSGHWIREDLGKLLDELALDGYREPAPGSFDEMGTNQWE